MAEQSVIHSTFVIERSFPVSPQRVFAAFSDPAKKVRWFAAGDHHEVEAFSMDFREGGLEKSRYRFKEGTPFAGVSLSSETVYLDIIPEKRVVTASTMSFADKRISAALVTIELLPTANGTDLICTHHGSFFEGADGPAIREAGWRKLFDRLAAELAG